MTATVFAARDESGRASTEQEFAAAVVRAGVVCLPVAVAAAALVWGMPGAASVGFAIGVVLVNLWVSATTLAWAARISYGLVMAVALFGFLLRMAGVAAAVLAVRNMDWVRPVPLGVTLVVAHLGLLAFEARRVSATLAFPGLAPKPVKEQHQ